MRILQSLLSALLAPLTALLALEVGLPPRPARWAGGVVALYPILWMYPVGLASENLFLPLLLAGMLYLIRGAQPGRKPSLWFSGLLLGAATLTRGGLVFFLPLAALWLAWVNRRWRALLFLLIPLFVLLPWSLRNSLLLGRPAFVENSMGYNLFVGYHPQGNGGFVTEVAAIPTRFLDDAQRDSWAMNQAIGFIREDPPRALELLLRRLGYFWGLEDRELLYFYSNGFFGEIPQPWLGLAYGILVLPLIGLGLSAPFGCALSLKGRESRGHWLMLGLIAATHLAYIPILAEPRFHLPLVPVLALWASQFWSAPQPLKALRMGIRKGEWVWWGATGVALLLVALWAWDLWQSQEVLLAVMQPGGHQLRLSY